jgi:hypothetical protein
VQRNLKQQPTSHLQNTWQDKHSSASVMFEQILFFVRRSKSFNCNQKKQKPTLPFMEKTDFNSVKMVLTKPKLSN